MKRPYQVSSFGQDDENFSYTMTFDTPPKHGDVLEILGAEFLVLYTMQEFNVKIVHIPRTPRKIRAHE